MFQIGCVDIPRVLIRMRLVKTEFMLNPLEALLSWELEGTTDRQRTTDNTRTAQLIDLIGLGLSWLEGHSPWSHV